MVVSPSDREDLEAEALTRMFEASRDTESDDDDDGGWPGDAEPQVQRVGELPSLEVEKWRQHLSNGHLPHRRDCKQCVEGAGLGVAHKRIRYPRSFSLSVDLFGPVPPPEAGRDKSCVTTVTGKNLLRYGLVGAFRVPRSMLDPSKGVDGVRDLFAGELEDQPDLADELADYEPSEPSDDLIPDWSPRDPLPPPPPPPPPAASSEFPVVVGAVSEENTPASSSLLEGEDLPQDDEGLRQLIKALRSCRTQSTKLCYAT